VTDTVHVLKFTRKQFAPHKLPLSVLHKTCI